MKQDKITNKDLPKSVAMEEFAEKLQRIAENSQRIDHQNPPTNRLKHEGFKSQEDIPIELRDDFLYLEVSCF